ncbi:MAG: hypothetical protein FWF66_06965 [Candidatus Bathyarchaeota archaeon]|nr:hypothetical protein [Candidatus Termiticorpusculum sp.]
MDLVAGCSGRGDCWVEVRPLITSEVETGKFTLALFISVLDALHSLGKPFRFFIVASRDSWGGGGERSLVRFFFEFFDEQTRVQMSNVIRAVLDVEVVGGANPLKHRYCFCADLSLAKNYALPIMFSGQHQELLVNLVDRLVASMAGLGVCLEVTAKADPNAAGDIQKFVYDKLSNKSSSSGISTLFLDPLTDLVGAGLGKNPQGETSTAAKSGRFGQNRVDSWSRELIKNAELKLASNLFTCQILVFGNSLQSVQAVKNALPAAPTNRFRIFKTTKKPWQSPATVLHEPSRYVVHNSILCRLWWAVPLSILLLAWFFGLFSPLRFVSSSGSLFSSVVVDVGVLGLVVFVAVCLFVVFRRRNAVVLSAQELSQIVGLPAAIAKLPVALGKVPVSRMQLGQEQTQEQDNNSKGLPASEED